MERENGVTEVKFSQELQPLPQTKVHKKFSATAQIWSQMSASRSTVQLHYMLQSILYLTQTNVLVPGLQ